jgi:hypothetical protein
MKRQNLSFVTQVNSCHVTDNGDTITIRSTTPVVDDIVMNGGLYPADEIANSYASLEGTPAPLDHPIDKDGQFISASNGDGLQKFYVGAVNKNVSYKDGVVESDVVINKAQALAHPRGQELIDRLANKKPIHISTGLMLQREQATGNSKGKDYTWIARNMKYDHVAILLNSEGAGTPSDGVGMWTNAEKTEFVVNHNEPEKEIIPKWGEKILTMLANAIPKGYNNPQAHIVPNNDSPENLQMNEEEVKALIAANASDAETKLQKKLDAVDAEHMKLKEEMKALKGGMKANEDAKKADLVAKVAKTLGLEANTLEGMEVEGLEALLGKSKSIAQVNSGGDDSANTYYTAEDLEAK